MYESWDHDTQISTAASMKVHHISLELVCFTSTPRNAGMKIAKVRGNQTKHATREWAVVSAHGANRERGSHVRT